MPWKGESDPYKIWLSEIILQQTRVEQGWAYYLKFIHQYPTIELLAQAPDNEVFKLWEGLGYYSRCRNLLAAARMIVSDYQGIFPKKHEEILKLQGVGPYTAAAIASFAFNEPYAVVDGNVTRILARYFGISTPFDSLKGKKEFATLAQTLLDSKTPAAYNQAIMDFGATVCKPAAPTCSNCPLQAGCMAFQNNCVGFFPVKEKKLVRKTRGFTYLRIFGPLGELVRQREGKDIWQQLFEFVLLEEKNAMNWDNETIQDWLKREMRIHSMVIKKTTTYTQQLTHQTVHARFIELNTTSRIEVPGYRWVKDSDISGLAFPQIIRQYLNPTATKQQAEV